MNRVKEKDGTAIVLGVSGLGIGSIASSNDVMIAAIFGSILLLGAGAYLVWK